MRLSSRQRQYLLVGQCLVPFAVNFVLNGLIGLAVFRGLNSVPTWALTPSAGPDTIGTCFFLPAITCLVVTPIVRRHIKRGMVEPLPGSLNLPVWLQPFQVSLPRRALSFGLLCLVLVGGLVAAAFLSVGSAAFSLTFFLWFKASFSALLGAAVTPLIGLVALAESSTEMQAA